MSVYLSGFILGGGMTLGFSANRRTLGDVSPDRPKPRLRVSMRAYRTAARPPQGRNCLLSRRNRTNSDPGACLPDLLPFIVTPEAAADGHNTNNRPMGIDMTIRFRTAALALALTVPAAGFAAPLALTPADPQPDPGALTPGLAVSYASIPSSVRDLAGAQDALERKAAPGAPLIGLSYDDTDTATLTSGMAEKVAADISGYIHFDAAGTYTLDFLNNDGLALSIGGEQVALYDGVHACGYAGEIDVEVPQAGYYSLEATFFQRKGTSCLMMEWGPDSDGLAPVPDSAFFH
ncbi:PA14 domain-containing protein [uncultured Roseobacter sp.]|uniref:PA14 domain-containing protein n=1 Tax=uncultured Roseobacter sp. TaxID=114847 RepID=UPI002631C0CB|nr:PA14 domain-containing protein [uncultured Roseobacter sp.]